MEKGEDQLIDWIASRVAQSRTGSARADDIIGIGDDMAILRIGDETILTAADMLMDGTHFDTKIHSPRQIGRKALAVNLSDCAAMAVKPWCALVSVALPANWPIESAQALFEGIATLADEFDCRIIGGDTNSWDKPLAIDVTIIAKPYNNIAPVRRSGATPGSSVFITERLGGSRAGRHMTFQPRVEEARQLATILGDGLQAMMDISDGLSTDAARMARASNVGMELDGVELESLASIAARFSAKTEKEQLQYVLNDGEDFELLFAVAPDRVKDVPDRVNEKSSPKAHGTEISYIGTVTSDLGINIIMPNGSREKLQPKGWQHFR